MDPSDSVVLYMVPGTVLGLGAGAISLEITFESNLTTPIITNVVIGVFYIFLSFGDRAILGILQFVLIFLPQVRYIKAACAKHQGLSIFFRNSLWSFYSFVFR